VRELKSKRNISKREVCITLSEGLPTGGKVRGRETEGKGRSEERLEESGEPINGLYGRNPFRGEEGGFRVP